MTYKKTGKIAKTTLEKVNTVEGKKIEEAASGINTVDLRNSTISNTDLSFSSFNAVLVKGISLKILWVLAK